ncbi:hypothetical protein I302_102896 [Kwoniella bestiolae CBS 10118]|uniref:Uncharacterized protein n=1 Tax=Kwoniella bestiolae CBS 10118 TaxID=1296100 RepID=A0A1B9GG84_9TREE|nr:hypothetical protein I302_01591 [Kwoniella bestiolae CBS 10118]OCF30072.1 hypothetical protein I302_01591 [Kwoniella bestiolae CBS 10118]
MSMLPPPFPPPKNKPKSSPASGSTSTSSPKAVQPDEALLKRIFKEFEDYKFTEDPVFNAGLPTVFNAIKGKKMSPGLIDRTIAEAQWFYFTTRIKRIPIPFTVYTSYVNAPPHVVPPSPSSSGSSSSSPEDPRLPNNTITQNTSAGKCTGKDKDKGKETKPSRMDHLTEAMRMMETKGTEGQTGLTFDKLCELIREGKAEELKGRDIPDELNPLPPSTSTLSSRPKPWQSQSQAPNTPSSTGTHPSPSQQHYSPDFGIFNAFPSPSTHSPMFGPQTALSGESTPRPYTSSSVSSGNQSTFEEINRMIAEGIDPNYSHHNGLTQNRNQSQDHVRSLDSDEIRLRHNQALEAQYISQVTQNQNQHQGNSPGGIPGFEFINWSAHEDVTQIPQSQSQSLSITNNHTNTNDDIGIDMDIPTIDAHKDEDEKMDDEGESQNEFGDI